MYEALLLDFYGTLVEEDDAIVARIAARISEASAERVPPDDISRLWYSSFTRRCASARGPTFRSQREIEVDSLRDVLEHCRARLDAQALAAEMFAYWEAPAAADGAAELVAALRIPVCVVSNIDRDDLAAAIGSLGWDLPERVTSECCRAYKPDPAPFEAALALLGCSSDRVLHVGDSFGSDVVGASALGIATVWVNRKGRPVPNGGPRPTRVVEQIRDLLGLLDGLGIGGRLV